MQKQEIQQLQEVDQNQLMLGENLLPTPVKLEAKIQKDEFVDMAKLFWDSIEADRSCTRDGGAPGSSGQQAQCRQEVPDILSWIRCFGVYTCIVINQQ